MARYVVCKREPSGDWYLKPTGSWSDHINFAQKFRSVEDAESAASFNGGQVITTIN